MRGVTALFAGCEAIRELADGYEFRFPGTREWLMDLTSFVREEQVCCSFFRFELIIEPNQGPMSLRLRGGQLVKEFVRMRLNTQGDLEKPANVTARDKEGYDGNCAN
jgi:hypothetical protein